MSAKRRPGNELTHDNWDDVEDQEEQGEFRKASEDEMKQRTIKVAKRRVPRASAAATAGDDDADGTSAAAPAASVFSGFSGFGSATGTKSAGSPFAFLSSGSGVGTSSSLGTASPFASISFGSASATVDKVNTSGGKEGFVGLGSAAKVDAESSADKSSEKSSTYYAKLKGLNQSVSAWISKHVTENAVCKLTPIFDDYARFLKEIEKLDEEKTEKATAVTAIKTPDYTFASAANSPKPTETVPKISFGAPSTFSTTDTKSSSSVFQMPSFGTTTKPSASSVASSSVPPSSSSAFSFGSLPASSTSTGFSFGSSSSTPFSFANASAGTSTGLAPSFATSSGGSSAGAVDDDNDEPPKNEFVPVVEEDSLFSKRCKVFVKTGAEFADRGVGQLFIKSADDGKKTQLLVRADTNLGNILLNILLTDAVPASRMGKNNVMMICIPTPDAKPPAATVLVRVKNAEEADELLEQIQKHKK